MDPCDSKLADLVEPFISARESLDSLKFDGNPAGRARKSKNPGPTARSPGQYFTMVYYDFGTFLLPSNETLLDQAGRRPAASRKTILFRFRKFLSILGPKS